MIHQPDEYRTERRKRGTKTSVAKLLGVWMETIARRESGVCPVTHEAWLALISIPLRRYTAITGHWRRN